MHSIQQERIQIRSSTLQTLPEIKPKLSIGCSCWDGLLFCEDWAYGKSSVISSYIQYLLLNRLAFERALQLDPTNVPSIIALAVVDLNTGTPEGIRNGIQALSLAYQNEPENPMVLNHLANHFFYRQVRNN